MANKISSATKVVIPCRISFANIFEAKSINGGEAKYSVSCLIRDLLDAVQDYAGEELRREIEEYIETNVQDIDDYEKEYDRMEQENERLADHQRSVLCDIRDEVDALDTLLQDTRLNRRRMQGAVRIIRQMINREL